ncbi:MAG: biotin/lipoyl-binding protein [Salinimicrobium sp.]
MKSIKYFVLGCTSILFLNSCSNEKEITTYRGKVKFETISVSSKLAGRVQELYVQEGQEVKKGDTLAIIDIPEVNAKLVQAEGAITSAKGQLDMAYHGATTEQLNQINGKLEAGKAQLDFAKQSYQRLQAMFRDSLVSRQQFDEVKMKLEMARAQVNALEAKRDEVVRGARSEQLAQARGQLDRAEGAKEEVLSAEKEKYVLAPADMSIETISLDEGELLTPGFSLFNGYKKRDMYFRFTVPESKVYDFKVGEAVTVINPYTKKEIKSRISAVKQLAQYADITSTAPLYELSEAIYELKLIPVADPAAETYYANATMLLKE